MVAQPGQRQSTFASGETEPLIDGRPDLKQFYQSGKRYLNFEPVPQGGFRLMAGSYYRGSAPSGVVQHVTLRSSTTQSYTFVLSHGLGQIFDNAGSYLGSLWLPNVTSSRIGRFGSYGEQDTLGLFHPDLAVPMRIVRSGVNWGLYNWDFSKIPEVDLGGHYYRQPDHWNFTIRWSENDTDSIVVSVTVDGEPTNAVNVYEWQSNNFYVPGYNTADWYRFAADLLAEIRALPSLSPGLGINVTQSILGTSAHNILVQFGGDNAGREYDFQATIVNTASASALSSHTLIGKTFGEPLYSVSRGGPAGAELVQDRLAYYGAKAVPASIASSRTGEYFDLNIEALDDAAARLDKIRSQSSEGVHYVTYSKYLVAFTETNEYFVPNRTISRNQPLDFVQTGSTGSRPYSGVQEFGGRLYYVTANGSVIYSTAYDEISTSFDPRPESLLASHLIEDVVSTAKQRSQATNDADKHWILRRDGRLVCGLIVQKEDIAGYCEWGAAGDSIKAMSVDGAENVWITVGRGNGFCVEQMDQNCLFQSAIVGQTDLSGLISGLAHLEGREVWAEAEGWIEGPFIVQGGQVELDHAYTAPGSVTIGLWQRPKFESHSHYAILPDDRVLRRPGRIHTVHAYVIDSQSIAIGANARDTEDVSLITFGTNMDDAFGGYTGKIMRQGISGFIEAPTMVVSQHRPGKLQIRDVTVEAKL